MSSKTVSQVDRLGRMLDRALKQAWMQGVRPDYLSDRLPNEDTLKNSIYYHLRHRLADDSLTARDLRIFTEYPLYYGQRADLAVIRLAPPSEGSPPLLGRVAGRLAIIECKFKGEGTGIEPFLRDVDKIRYYAHQSAFSGCLFYLATIDESAWEESEVRLLDGRQMRGWGSRVAELTCSYVRGNRDPVFRVISYNGLNPDLSSDLSPR